MKHISLKRCAATLILAIAAISASNAQTAEIISADAHSVGYKDNFHKIAFSNEHGTYCLRVENYKPHIERLNAEMKVEKAVSFDIVEKRDGGVSKVIHDLLRIKNNIWVFSAIYYRKTKETAFVAQKIDPISLNYTSPEIELGRNKQTYFHSHNETIARQVVNKETDDIIASVLQSAFIATSDNSSLILYMNDYNLNILNKPEAIKLMAFDDEMKKLWETEKVFNYNANDLTIIKIVADSKTNVFMVAESRSKGKTTIVLGGITSTAVTPLLLTFTDQGKTAKEFTLKYTGITIAQLNPAISINSKLILTGTEVDKNARATGVYCGVFDINTLAFTSQTVFPFGAEFVKEDLSSSKQAAVDKKADKGKEPSIENLFYNNSIVADDGTLYVAFAEGREIYSNETGVNLLAGYYHRRYLIFGFDTDGKQKWKNKITRASLGELNLGKFNNHCALMLVNNALCAVYFDDPKENEFQSVNSETSKATDNAGIVLAMIDKATGNVSKHLLYSSSRLTDNLPYISHSLVKSTKELFFCCYRQNKYYQYGLIKFK
ncbi:MAG: hypothetical protein MUC87_02880 [Bacteroidia bacterium]|jgi:hypothetical protein|nr:hypothetical protein [Bacteroidia bacterium]